MAFGREYSHVQNGPSVRSQQSEITWFEINVTLWLVNRALLFNVENESCSLGSTKGLVDRRYSYGVSDLLCK
jgi:hypothetical protein